ncbi:MAG: hypothetical protein K2X82_13235 [Gemmataceae bacterium]|nr:hypothetical protein [Gemmataceae bacterium]
MGGWAVGAAVVAMSVGVAQPATKDTPAAERTRTKLLAVKVSGEFRKVPLREVLKEFAHQVEVEAGRPVMWTYEAGDKAGDPVTVSCRGKPLEKVLDDLFKGPGLGYVVVSEDDHPRDGWVRVVAGAAPGEAEAAGRLAAAREALADGKAADAKALLRLVARKYPGTKAAAEAEKLLADLEGKKP